MKTDPSQEDWRLLGNVQHLRGKEMEPADGRELLKHFPEPQRCIFCSEQVERKLHKRWYVPVDKACCICEGCFQDFRKRFHWKLLDGWDLVWPDGDLLEPARTEAE